MIREIVAKAKREWHAGGMPLSAEQEQVAGNARSFTGQYLAPLLARVVSSPAQAGVQAPKAKSKGRKGHSSGIGQPDLLAAK